MRLLSNLLRRFIRQGTLRVRDAEGTVHVFGECLPGPEVAIRLHDRKLYYKLFINPELYAAEAYILHSAPRSRSTCGTSPLVTGLIPWTVDGGRY